MAASDAEEAAEKRRQRRAERLAKRKEKETDGDHTQPVKNRFLQAMEKEQDQAEPAPKIKGYLEESSSDEEDDDNDDVDNNMTLKRVRPERIDFDTSVVGEPVPGGYLRGRSRFAEFGVRLCSYRYRRQQR